MSYVRKIQKELRRIIKMHEGRMIVADTDCITVELYNQIIIIGYTEKNIEQLREFIRQHSPGDDIEDQKPR